MPHLRVIEVANCALCTCLLQLAVLSFCNSFTPSCKKKKKVVQICEVNSLYHGTDKMGVNERANDVSCTFF